LAWTTPSWAGRWTADIFAAYQSPLLAEIPDALELDPSHRLLPVDYGDVCLNYDKAWFAENGVPLPGSLADLADPAYAGLLVVQNPATSSPWPGLFAGDDCRVWRGWLPGLLGWIYAPTACW
jgi:ABC-type thiamine transport system substrate-binding protein